MTDLYKTNGCELWRPLRLSRVCVLSMSNNSYGRHFRTERQRLWTDYDLDSTEWRNHETYEILAPSQKLFCVFLSQRTCFKICQGDRIFILIRFFWHCRLYFLSIKISYFLSIRTGIWKVWYLFFTQDALVFTNWGQWNMRWKTRQSLIQIVVVACTSQNIYPMQFLYIADLIRVNQMPYFTCSNLHFR